MNSILKFMFIAFFVSHIPITLILDMQVVFGRFYPRALQDLNRWYYTTHKDFLIENPPLWLWCMVAMEVVFQLPYFFLASYALIYEKNWIRIPSIAYGGHVVTTVVPLLAEFASSKLELIEKMTLISFYTPYLVIPAILTIYMCFTETPFPMKNKSL
mmetsp:Transcript_29129/g.29484  ORF Transcript_29129/g.29484 Transcript_29129/m.29484 type:complete len:157 (-) Transcript_29129:28-498(-)